MICDHLPALLGFACMPLDARGETAMVEVPFQFADGTAMSVFVRDAGGQHCIFFDDGMTAWHLQARGLRLHDARNTKFLKRIAQTCQVTFTEDWGFEVAAPWGEAAAAYARLQRALLAAADWESDTQGTNLDASLFLDQVAEALQAAAPHVPLERDVDVAGITQQHYRFDFRQGATCYLAVQPRTRSSGTALRKLLDVKNLPSNAALDLRVVLEDQSDPEAAHRESMLLAIVAQVETLSSLQAQAARILQ